jgi:hypothetical protein
MASTGVGGFVRKDMGMAAFKRHFDVWRSQLTIMSQRRSLRLTSYQKMELDLPPPIIFVVGMTTTQHSPTFVNRLYSGTLAVCSIRRLDRTKSER